MVHDALYFLWLHFVLPATLWTSSLPITLLWTSSTGTWVRWWRALQKGRNTFIKEWSFSILLVRFSYKQTKGIQTGHLPFLSKLCLNLKYTREFYAFAANKLHLFAKLVVRKHIEHWHVTLLEKVQSSTFSLHNNFLISSSSKTFTVLTLQQWHRAKINTTQNMEFLPKVEGNCALHYNWKLKACHAWVNNETKTHMLSVAFSLYRSASQGSKIRTINCRWCVLKIPNF